MENPIKLTEKYERNGWPSVKRPDIKPPAGWNLSLLTSLERIRSHSLSSQGQIVCIKDGETLSDVFTMWANGGWLARISTDRGLVPYWDDEIPQWSPDGASLAFVVAGHVHIARAAGGLPLRITDFTTVLTAQQALLSEQDSLASTLGDISRNLVGVYRALGGGWEIREGQDFVPAEIKETMAKRTNWGRLLAPAAVAPAPEGQHRLIRAPDW